MPALLGRDDKQFDAIDANKSRFVTKCWWVVEVVNSFLKSFKALKHVPNKSLPHTFQDYKISAAFINRFFQRLTSDEEDFEVIIQNMKKKIGDDEWTQAHYWRKSFSSEKQIFVTWC